MHIYEGSLDHPFGPYNGELPPRTEPEPPAPAGRSVVTVSTSEVKTLLAVLDVAADDKRDRAETCADCIGQRCLTCQSRLQEARAYDRMAVQLIQATEATAASHPGPASKPQPAADRGPASDQAPDGAGMKQKEDSTPSRPPGRRPPDYVIVISFSDWLKDRFPGAATCLSQALQTGQGRHREPEPDLEAEL